MKTFDQYRLVLKWLIGDSIWRFRKESFLILFTNFIGVSFQVWTIGLAIYYAKAMQSGSTIKLLHYEFNARTSNVFLIFMRIINPVLAVDRRMGYLFFKL
ncbi:hypothetical protein [Candidatus Kuenenia stuttgartiensis]|uniref:hypothetical protein n=1 Tax=Kuenenia stuttgartiensis TaxID=174633 RepID=UPI00146C00C6|nr:hypothetical protein [Candidatus Kuenenia stuttgartiensis]